VRPDEINAAVAARRSRPTVNRALDGACAVADHMEVDLRGTDIAVAEQRLNQPECRSRSPPAEWRTNDETCGNSLAGAALLSEWQMPPPAALPRGADGDA
jgi:hypothetical protein